MRECLWIRRRSENAADAHELRVFSVPVADMIGDPDVDQVHHVHREHGIRPQVALLLHLLNHLPQLVVLRDVRRRIGIAGLQEGHLLAGAVLPCVPFQFVENALEHSRALPSLNDAVQRIDACNQPLVVLVEFLHAYA